jgi:hypothetical protein
MKYLLVSLIKQEFVTEVLTCPHVYKVCSNKSLGVKICRVPGDIDFPYLYILKIKMSTFKKPKELVLRYKA